MPELPLTWLDVFTDVSLAGNGLAVVHEADAVDDDTMLRFARETKLSETSFIQAATVGADYRNRFWTMDGEIPFAGHPSLGAAVAVARLRGQSGGTLRQETVPGVQPIDVELTGDVARASMLQEPAVFGPEVDPSRVAAAAGLSTGDLLGELGPQVVSTGVPQLLAPVSAEALADVAPDGEVARALLKELSCVVIYLVSPNPAAGTARARSFMVAPDGVSEDPATGSAVGPLCAYLERHTGKSRVVVEQGVEMGRRSVLEAEMEDDRARVSGDVVIVAEGTVRL